MKSDGVFLNGVYEDVLTEILAVQEHLPDQTLFLQPYSGSPIVRLRNDPPSVDSPVPLLISVTTDLPTVRYKAEIIGWDDKRTLPIVKREVLNRIIGTLQPNEKGLYDASRVEGAPSVNLLYVRRLRKLSEPFGIEKLTKVVDGEPASPGRTTAGGWVYVRVPAV